MLVVANTGTGTFTGAVVVDRDIHTTPRAMRVAYSNLGTPGSGPTRHIPAAMFHAGGQSAAGAAAALDVVLAVGEVQVLVPA